MDPISAVAIGSTALGGVTKAAGSIFGGMAESQAYTYKAGVAQMNQQIAEQNKDYAIYSGEVEAQREGIKTRQEIGQTVAQQGAGGLAVGSGSNARVVESELKVGQQNAALIRSDAAKRAYGFEVEALKYGAEATLDKMAASKSKIAGIIGGVGSLLGTGGSVAAKWLTPGMVDTGGGAGDPSFG